MKADPKINPQALHEHAVRKEDKARYHSDVHKAFNLIYTRENKVVRGYKKCKFCRKLFKINQKKSGNSRLERHDCYVNRFVKTKGGTTDDDKSQNSGSSSDDSDEDELMPRMLEQDEKEILAKAFADISKLPTINKNVFGKILPKNWSKASW